MPTQLYKNSNVYFICARNFLWDGVEYQLGDEFDQDIAPGRLDLLIRTRRLFAVVENTDVKPRHWHHHIWTKEQIEQKLNMVVGSSAFTRQPQVGITFDSVETIPAKKWEDQDMAAVIKANAIARAATQEVLNVENAEGLGDGCVGEHDPSTNEDCDMGPAEPQNVAGDANEPEDEPAITEEDLWDPTTHTVDEVMDYLTGDISEEERTRVVAVEQANKNRKGIVDHV